MKTIARILCWSVFFSALAGGLGIVMFRDYPDYLVPAIFFSAAGSIVGAISGSAAELVQLRKTTGLVQ